MGDYLQYTFNTENPEEIIRSVRSGDQLPAHYTLDVDPFSQVASSLLVDSCFLESTEFNVGGYRWVIQIYPNENEKDNGDGHISIYLKLCDKLKPHSFINVIFRALIYDQERNKYLVIQDLQEKRFDASNTIRGMPKTLPQSALYAECNGFLMHDRCTFGAEVFIINTNRPTSAKVLCVNDNSNRQYTWRVERFSEISNSLNSPEFIIDGRSWYLCVYPKGNYEGKDKFRSLYLHLVQCNDLTAGNKLYIEFEMGIKDQLNRKDCTVIFQYPFQKSLNSWGRCTFVPISDLLIPYRGLVMDDVVLFEVRFKHSFMLSNRSSA
ncbi:hypothetical protein Ancab_028387 [Ancistrocladus abbreviatus]